ncbi:MAPK regulated corepressor interacting protein 2-like isoform X1 [Bacillus rossius redtenbacheri]|uniref:MAPK regulated corepressor interacting protein 2-like isoform X1 n=1 Tax=Bacillus rossius redtenbacheri TaxID=93214 RepID=UPI002FDEA3A7
MYTVSKGPSKIVAKTRRGIPHTQNIERLEILRDQLTKKSADTVEDDSSILLNGPKPVFHTVNGKRSSSVRSQQEAITPQHAALINFVYESWEQVCREYEQEPLQQGASQGRHVACRKPLSQPSLLLQPAESGRLCRHPEDITVVSPRSSGSLTQSAACGTP